jgi:hypothetical protein
VRRHGMRGSLSDGLDGTVWDLNEEWAQMMLWGRTARDP